MLCTVAYRRIGSVFGTTGVQTARRFRKLTAARWSSSSGNDSRSDAELCTQYYNVFNLGKMLLEAQQDTVELERLQHKVAPGDTGAASRLYVAQRDPLFKRYQIDIFQAIDGAKFALETILRLLGSKEFAEYAASTHTETSLVKPDAVSWLTELMDQEQFERELVRRRKAIDMGTAMVLRELEVGDVWFVAGASQMVEEPSLPMKAVHYLLGKPYAPPHPLGSVSAFLDVKCRVKQARERLLLPGSTKNTPEEVLTAQDPQDVNSEGEEIERRTVEVIARFRACISGQVPLQWKLDRWSIASVLEDP